MDIDRLIDIGITMATLGITGYLGYATLKKMGIVKNHTTLTIRGRKVRLSQAEVELFCECAVDPRSITTTFDDIGGHEDIKEKIQRNVVFPFNHPELFPVGSLRTPPKGLLLYGPPGTGKTMLARAIAREANAFFMDLRIESVFSKWVGESEQNAAAIFTLARLCQPSIIFVDEIDSLLSDRGGDSGSNGGPVYNNAKTIFLRHWDGFHSSNDRVVVVGATNMPQVLDPAVLRRMPVQVEVHLPTAEERRSILTVTLSQEDTSGLDFGALVRETAGFSGSDLRGLCVDACSLMVFDAVKNGKVNATTQRPEMLCLSMRNFEVAMRERNKKGFRARTSYYNATGSTRTAVEEAAAEAYENNNNATVTPEKLAKAMPIAMMLAQMIP
eukprot:PhM_4_TR2282/c0_g1_i1/m.15139